MRMKADHGDVYIEHLILILSLLMKEYYMKVSLDHDSFILNTVALSTNEIRKLLK